MATDTTKESTTGAPFPVTMVRHVVDVDGFDDVAGYVRVYGREIAVHHLDAIAYRVLRELAENPQSADVGPSYDIVARCCPELTREEVDRLSAPKVGLIIATAQRGVREVEAQAPNAAGPAETTETTDTSSPPA